MIKIKRKTEFGIVNINMISYFLMLVAMYSVSTISSYTMSWAFTIALLSIAACAMLAKVKNNKIILNKNSLLWILVIMFCFLCSIKTKDFRDFVFYFLSGVIIIGSFSAQKECLYKCFYVMVAGAVIFAAGVFLQFFYPNIYDNYIFPLFPGLYRSDILRQYYAHKMYTGLSSETSISAQFMIMGNISLYCLYPNMKGRQKIVAWGAAIIFSVGIILTGKRSSLLFFSAALIYTMLVAVPNRQKLNRFLKVFLALIIIAIIGSIVLPKIVSISTTRNTIVRLFESANEDDISNGRFEIWINAIQGFWENPFTGKGWSWFKQNYGYGAHNIYLQLLCECGIAVTIIIVGVLLTLYYNCHQNMKKVILYKDPVSISLYKMCMFSQTYILLYGFTGNPLYNYSFFLWYAFSLCILVNNDTLLAYTY